MTGTGKRGIGRAKRKDRTCGLVILELILGGLPASSREPW